MPAFKMKRSVKKAKFVLTKIYRQCYVLEELAEPLAVLEDNSNRPTCDGNYNQFLQNTLVAFSQSADDVPFLGRRDSDGKPNVVDVVNTKRHDWIFSNVARDICSPFNQTGRASQTGRFFGAILPFKTTSASTQQSTSCPGPTEPYMDWTNWDRLQEGLGDQAFLFLLQKCSFFVLLPSRVVFQIIGQPAVNALSTGVDAINRPAHKSDESRSSESRLDGMEIQTMTVTRKRSHEDMSFGEVPVGQPLKRLKADNVEHADHHSRSHHPGLLMPVPETSQELETEATWSVNQQLHIPWQFLLYSKTHRIAFPKRHILESLKGKTESEVGEELFNGIFHGDAKSDVELKFCHNNQKLKELLVKLADNHFKCDFVKMVWAHCSPRIDSSANQVSKKKKCKKKNRKNIPQSEELPHCSKQQLHALLRAIVHRIMPLELFGSKGNKTKFQRFLGVFLNVSLKDALSTKQLINGAKVSDCQWMPEEFDEHTRMKWYVRFLEWIFTSYILPCLQGLFYVTEVGGSKKRLFYLTKRHFGTIKSGFLSQMISESFFIPLSFDEAKRLLSSGYSQATMRILPKKRMARPIVTRKSSTKKVKILQAALEYVTSTCDGSMKHPDSMRKISKLWLNFVGTWRQLGQPKIHFVKSDILNCFGSMNQRTLHGIIHRVFGCIDTISVHSYCALNIKDGRLIRKFKHWACSDNDSLFNHWKNFEMGREVIIVDLLKSVSMDGCSFADQVMNYIEKFVIKANNQYYIMPQGVAQGSPLSPILCKLYYDQMELMHLSEFVSNDADKLELLIRYMDDYLFVSPDMAKAHHFLDNLVKGVPDFNCYINIEKTLTTIEYQSHQLGVHLTPFLGNKIPWLGMMIDQNTLEMSVDYSRYAGASLGYSMALSTATKEGVRNMVMNVVKINVEAIFFDSRINSETTAVRTLFNIGLMLAFRVNSLILKVHSDDHPKNHPSFYGTFIFKCLSTICSTITALVLYDGLQWTLSCFETKWILLKGLIRKFERHRSMYNKVLGKLLGAEKHFQSRIDQSKVRTWKNVMGQGIPDLFKKICD